VHYGEIKGARGNPAFALAQDWLSFYFIHAIRFCPFKAFVVEHGPNRTFPFPGEPGYPDHAEHALLSSFIGGIAWSFNRTKQLDLRLVFDDSDNELDKSLAWGLPARLESEVLKRRLEGTRRYPLTTVKSIEFVNSNPLKAEIEVWPEAELIQLCDLLLGALSMPWNCPAGEEELAA